MDRADFSAECRGLGLEIDDATWERFTIYLDMLLQYNEQFNLTTITEPREVWRKHFLDSLSLFLVLKSPSRIVDIGSGAGFPGLPLAITGPEFSVTVVDSLGKRVNFMEQVVARLELAGRVTVVKARAEDLGRQSLYRERFDYAVTRAVGSLSVLAEYCLPLVKRGGMMVAMKGPAVTTEIDAAQRAVKILGGGNLSIMPWVMPHGGEQRLIVQIRKEQLTPAAFPRRAGLPAKQPL